MSAEGGADVPSRLLYAVAKGREEAVSLAVQLAEKSDRVEAERAVAARLRERRDELERALAECRDALDVSRQSAVDAEARASKSRADAERAVAAAQEEWRRERHRGRGDGGGGDCGCGVDARTRASGETEETSNAHQIARDESCSARR